MSPFISSIVRAVENSAADSFDCCCRTSPSRTPLAISCKIVVSAGVSPNSSEGCFRLLDGSKFGAITSSTSWAQVIGVAPCLSRLLQPSDSGLVILPGTTNTSLPWDRACDAVFRVPLLAAASVMITASANPLTSLLRFKKEARLNVVLSPLDHSDMTAPPLSIMRLASGTLVFGDMSGSSSMTTPIVMPPASNAAW